MKRSAIEEFQLGEIQEAFDMARSIVCVKSDFYVPQCGGDHGLRVFLLELKGRWCRHGEPLYQVSVKVINPE